MSFNLTIKWWYNLVFWSLCRDYHLGTMVQSTSKYAAKSLQSCPTLCDPRDCSPPGSPIPGILQARTLEWVAITFSNAWKWKVKVKSPSCVRLLATPWTARLLHPWDFPGKSTGVGCHCLLQAHISCSVIFVPANLVLWIKLVKMRRHLLEKAF